MNRRASSVAVPGWSHAVLQDRSRVTESERSGSSMDNWMGLASKPFIIRNKGSSDSRPAQNHRGVLGLQYRERCGKDPKSLQGERTTQATTHIAERVPAMPIHLPHLGADMTKQLRH